ncbi:MAG: HlyD family type I secretion periplasmic adaptor subunit [Rhodospirillaceae bacterium]|nr:HlyD family type I secretion periplasmic adaptor subunit [Rhodospirillales bacterium]
MSGMIRRLGGPLFTSHNATPVDQVGGRTALRVGMVTIMVAFGGFGLWAALAPLNAAAVARGEVKVENYRKTIQHMEGGMIRSILVRDGDVVDAGQPVMLLDDIAIRARWTQLTFQSWATLATMARLRAEQAQATSVDFAATMPNMDHPRALDVIRAQDQLFKARRAMLDGQIAVLRKRMVLNEREAESLAAQQKSADRQLALIQQEIRSTQYLVDRGLGRRPQLLSLQREGERLTGQRDDYGARIARLQQAQASTELDIANITFKQMDDVANSLREAEGQSRDLEQQLAAITDSLKRTVVRSPQSGVVMGLNFHTIGAVLQPGEKLMDVVPENENLIVEARIAPEDIDRVYPGREAQVRFHTFLRGLTPPAKGTVTQISADLFRDERNNAPYYQARVTLDPDSLTHLPGPLTPGMQTDVLITTGERTALEYLIEPLSRAVSTAMREK